MAIGLSYPKPRDPLVKTFPILRTDNATLKCVLPKNSVVLGIHVNQTSNAVTGGGAFDLGWAGTPQALVAAFSMPIAKVGLANPGAQTGASVGVKLDSDKQVISTYTAGTSTAGGEGYVVIEYVVLGGGEDVYS